MTHLTISGSISNFEHVGALFRILTSGGSEVYARLIPAHSIYNFTVSVHNYGTYNGYLDTMEWGTVHTHTWTFTPSLITVKPEFIIKEFEILKGLKEGNHYYRILHAMRNKQKQKIEAMRPKL